MPGTLTGLILIVDDLPTNLAVICEALSGVGLEVAIATSGERALQQVARERPDLILLDLLMPGLDGFETCQRLKANPSTHDIPVIFMTALADTESKVTALALGAVDYVTKPFQEQEVLARVRTHLQLSRLTQTLEQSVHQAIVALQASRVAEDVRKAAIAREQEQVAQDRVAELEKVNDALKRSLDALATDSDLNQFVSHVLKTVAEQLDAPVVEYWSTSNNIAYLELTCWQGKVFNREQLADCSHKQVVAVPPELAAHETSAQRQRHSIVDDLLNDPLHVRLYSALKCDLAAWCNQHKVRRELNVPLRIGASIIGTLCVYFPADRPFSDQQIELSYALAQQVTLSLRLTQLAEEAKQAAIAREQEQAAQVRVAELAIVNEALQQRDHEVQQSYRLLSVVAQVTKDLLEAEEIDTAIPAALHAVAVASHINRILLLFECRNATNQELEHHPVYSWIEPGFMDASHDFVKNSDYAALIQRLKQGQIVWNVTANLPEPLRQRFEELDIQSSGVVPVFIEGQYVGCLAFDDCVTPRQWSQQELDVFFTAAESIGAALHRKQLTDRLVAERLRAEQERVGELAKANAALKQTLDVLATEPELDRFLGHVLLVITQHLGAQSSSLWLFDWTAQTATLHLVCQDNQIMPSAQAGYAQTMLPFADFCDDPGWSAILVEQRSWVQAIDPTTSTFADIKGFLANQDIRTILSVPLVMGDQAIGAFNIHFKQSRTINPESLELVQALVHQATLAIRMHQLAEAAKQAAIAREQEQAAQARAVELAKGNETLQAEVVERHRAERSTRGQAEVLVRILAAFAAAPVLDNFLGIVLQAIVEQLGDHSGGVWLYDEVQNTTVLHLNYEDGQIQQGSQITRPGTDPSFPQQWDRDYMQVLRQQKILIQDRRQPVSSPAYAAYHAYNQQRGIKMILVVALFFGDIFLGNITLRRTAYRDYKPEELELVRVLAHQAALAIQLTRLAEQGKQAAISEERNRMAREIHDTLAQSFTSIRMQLEAAIRLLGSKPEQAQGCITAAQGLAKSGLAEARRSVWALQPEAEDYRHLSITLQRLAVQQTAETSIPVKVVIVGTPYALPPDIGMNLLRIGQEALTNALRHASAQTILTLTYAPDQIQLQIQDDGQGFDPQLENSGGFGLIGMQQRSDRLGGIFTINSQPGHGTEVAVTVPVEGQ